MWMESLKSKTSLILKISYLSFYIATNRNTSIPRYISARKANSSVQDQKTSGNLNPEMPSIATLEKKRADFSYSSVTLHGHSCMHLPVLKRGTGAHLLFKK